MPKAFHDHIQSALANPNLQAALDANAERRILARGQAWNDLGDPKAVRQQARAIRAEVITHLDQYVDAFVAKAQENGLIVHRARDAAQAVAIILEIARQHNAHLIAKSKTMVSEEIHLNPALEAAGLEVVETDLGEYIVQLRGEAPAHIITPAVHLLRGDVARTFHEKLGMPFTDDIPTMTQVARQKLRQVFLSSGIGLSGVNFGVVETGTLCVLTNEGNGRMVTTVPPVHIALMGMERLVPTRSDLAVMLSLLPRSATGQKITVYTSLLNGPRRSSEPDGPQERHLVLLDNGRTAIQQSPLAEALYCIRCGSCLNACPVFRELGGHAYVGIHGQGSAYPGPIGSVLSPALFGQSEFGHLARASSLCGACKEACPVDIDLPALLLRVRAGGLQIEPRRAEQTIPWALKTGLSLFGWAASHPAFFYVAQRAAGVFSRLLAPVSPWLKLPKATGWGTSKDFPRPAARPFHELFAARRVEKAVIQIQPACQEKSIKEQETATVSSGLEGCGHQELTGRFIKELNTLGGKVIETSGADLPGQIASLLESKGIQRIQAWDESCLPAGLLGALQVLGISVVHSPDPGVRAGLTGCLAAAAETGSMLISAAAGQPLTASLLPEVHIAVLLKGDILPAISDVLTLDTVKNASASVLVTGPSRTADIEMTLTIGVHGPGEVYTFLL